MFIVSNALVIHYWIFLSTKHSTHNSSIYIFVGNAVCTRQMLIDEIRLEMLKYNKVFHHETTMVLNTELLRQLGTATKQVEVC